VLYPVVSPETLLKRSATQSAIPLKRTSFAPIGTWAIRLAVAMQRRTRNELTCRRVFPCGKTQGLAGPHPAVACDGDRSGADYGSFASVPALHRSSPAPLPRSPTAAGTFSATAHRRSTKSWREIFLNLQSCAGSSSDRRRSPPGCASSQSKIGSNLRRKILGSAGHPGRSPSSVAGRCRREGAAGGLSAVLPISRRQ